MAMLRLRDHENTGLDPEEVEKMTYVQSYTLKKIEELHAVETNVFNEIRGSFVKFK